MVRTSVRIRVIIGLLHYKVYGCGCLKTTASVTIASIRARIRVITVYCRSTALQGLWLWLPEDYCQCDDGEYKGEDQGYYGIL
jgi:hypothetical protein